MSGKYCKFDPFIFDEDGKTLLVAKNTTMNRNDIKKTIAVFFWKNRITYPQLLKLEIIIFKKKIIYKILVEKYFIVLCIVSCLRCFARKKFLCFMHEKLN